MNAGVRGDVLAADRRGVQCVGDRAGEHLTMARGRYGAWLYVVIAFGLQIWAVAALGIAIWEQIADALGVPMVESHVQQAAIVVGIAAAIATFWDRWRVVEAFASRFCSGLMNLSLVYVPVVAWAYANYRAAAKLRGR